MNKMTFPNACQVMRWHFHPLGFEASMDAPRSMVARLFDRATGETLLAIAGILRGHHGGCGCRADHRGGGGRDGRIRTLMRSARCGVVRASRSASPF